MTQSVEARNPRHPGIHYLSSCDRWMALIVALVALGVTVTNHTVCAAGSWAPSSSDVGDDQGEAVVTNRPGWQLLSSWRWWRDCVTRGRDGLSSASRGLSKVGEASANAIMFLENWSVSGKGEFSIHASDDRGPTGQFSHPSGASAVVTCSVA
jgi:hypothetical protein